MRLISCYVEGYGAIHKKEYRFDEGITSFLWGNGEGKTTLSSFIKAMFYGMEKEKKNSFVDRTHFYPFSGGKYGGSLTFLYEGKEYRIEREFDKKSETGDTLKVYCNGALTDELGPDIGRTVFGVDNESFTRTLFINDDAIEIASTASINSKLGNFLQGMEGEDNFEKAVERLDKARKNYKADRRSKTPTDAIPLQELKIASLKTDLLTARKIEESLAGKYEQAASLREEIKSLTEQITTAQNENTRLEQMERYESLLQTAEEKRRGAVAILGRYANGLPDEKETEEVNDCLATAQSLRAQANGLVLSVREEERLAYLDETFKDGAPTEEVLLAIDEELSTLIDLERENKTLNSTIPTSREGELKQKFAYKRPTEEELTQTAAKVEAYKQAKKAYEETEEHLTSTVVAKEEKTPKPYKGVAVMAIIVAIVGVVMMALDNMLVGGIALGVGVVALLADAFAYLNGKVSMSQTATMSVLNPEKQKKKEDMLSLEYALKSALSLYGYHSDNGVVFDFAQLCKDVTDYADGEALSRNREYALAENVKKEQAIEEGLSAFFHAYRLDGDGYGKRLNTLRGWVGDYNRLKERKTELVKKKTDLLTRIADLDTRAQAYAEKYALTVVNVEEIKTDVRDYNRLRLEVKTCEETAERFKADKGLSIAAQGEKVDLQSLNERLSELNRENSRLSAEITSEEIETERIAQLETELEAEEERLKEFERKYKALAAAKTFLEKADEQLRNKYVTPVLDEFVGYADVLGKVLGEKVAMSKSLEVSFEKDGAMHSEKHLSAGQRSICALCFRLALIKNMYKDNHPFLILDDPFVALDEAHMEKVKALLSALSMDMQMVYFTCHESRML